MWNQMLYERCGCGKQGGKFSCSSATFTFFTAAAKHTLAFSYLSCLAPPKLENCTRSFDLIRSYWHLLICFDFLDFRIEIKWCENSIEKDCYHRLPRTDGIRYIGILNGLWVTYSKSPQKLDQTEREKLKRKGLKKVVYVRIVGMIAQLDQFATLLPRARGLLPSRQIDYHRGCLGRWLL